MTEQDPDVLAELRKMMESDNARFLAACELVAYRASNKSYGEALDALRAENERLRRDLAHEQCERERLAKQLGASRDARQEAERERDRLREAAKAVYKHMLDSPLAHVPDSIFVPLEETLMDLDTPTPEDDQ